MEMTYAKECLFLSKKTRGAAEAKREGVGGAGNLIHQALKYCTDVKFNRIVNFLQEFLLLPFLSLTT
jgi:hypothetical protein